jgi:alanine dehydrogenase
VTLPQRTAIRIPEHGGIHLTMPAYVGDAPPARNAATGPSPSGGSSGEPALGGALAVKVVSVYPENPGRYSLPTTIGTLLLQDPRCGALLAVMDAGFLTAMRTGAASGSATRRLAREDARTVGLFGAGVQGRTQLLGVHAVRRIERVLVCDPSREARDRFVQEMGTRLSVRVEATDDARACASCDIVITASSSKSPVFDGSWLVPGAHVNCVGSHSPDARELDTEAVRRCRIVCDHVPARLAEDADFMVPIREGAIRETDFEVSLGEVITGSKPGRRSREEITLFKSGGLAVQDAVTAARVYELARRAGVGREVEI